MHPIDKYIILLIYKTFLLDANKKIMKIRNLNYDISTYFDLGK